MARPTKPTPPDLKDARKDDEISVKIVHDHAADVPYYYVNNIEVSYTAHDFTLSCAKIPSRLPASVLEEAQRSSQLVTIPLVHLYVPTTMIVGLIRALSQQKEHYEAKFGPLPKLEGEERSE